MVEFSDVYFLVIFPLHSFAHSSHLPSFNHTVPDTSYCLVAAGKSPQQSSSAYAILARIPSSTPRKSTLYAAHTHLAERR